MTVFENNILKSLTGKSSFDQVSVQELESIIHKYPAFSTAQLLLAKKLRQIAPKEDAAIHQTQKTALFFTNTFWLHHLLQDSTHKITGPFNNKITSEETVFVEPESDSIENEELVTVNENEQQLSVEEEELAEIEAETREEIPADSVIEPIQDINHAEEAEIANVQNVAGNDTSDVVISQQEEVEEKIAGFEAPQEAHNLSAAAISETKELLLAAEKEPETFAIDKSHFTKDLISTDEFVEEEEELEDDEPLQDMTPELSKVLTAQMAEFSKPIDDTTRLPIESEPYHTIDYFDSQGIKLDANKPQDTVDKKVRKFTDWLKNMKRHNIQPNDLGTDPEMEHAIQQIAETSNESREILTETMAEVYIKQGKILSAINLYKKLSFLNPDKTTYFAAKIKQIKDL
ncbi:hypothetical protein QTN47_06645 [Danxiaibacter flavus]|uniref:Tetratricopeptide repeat protein n=1 Tax=Danxiaibacter flavus TaxID=3049108 RepID=A0ABV3ZCG0_9BACT|nr:hypothetical protein QNM32_06645 [Chitinophagaceae bacterium DXS]